VNDDLLRDSLRELYERAPCGYLFTLPDGTITRVNQTFLDWTGYERGELVSGRRFQDLLTVAGKIFYENQYAPLLRLQGFVNEVAFDLVRPNQEPLPVLVNSVERRGADGPPLLVASTIFNATDRRAYERELLRARQEAERLAAVVTASGDAIVTATPDGIVETWNAAAERLFGYTAGAMIGRHLSVVLPFLADGERERITSELRAGHNVLLEGAATHADGRRVDASVGLTPHPGPLGELAAISAIIRDVSERKALERLQQEFLAMASHELRNPLGVIKGYAQLMRRRGTYDEQAVDGIVSQSDRLGRLIEDLLLASQIAAERLILRPEELDLVEEVRAAVEHQRVNRAAIHVEAPDEQLVVSADRLRLGQVLTNLLANAVKYAPPDTDIVVRAARADDEARIEVVDRGVGIPPDALPRLFERFYRVAGTAERVQGLGLGLYISRRIVEAHRGRISVVSEPGRGSTFIVCLPIASPPDP
jgi:PAS domain S-box-containing protein